MSAIIDTLQETLRSAPESWKYRLALIEALLAEGQSEQATSVLEQAPPVPSDPESMVFAARAHGLLNPDNGHQILDSAIQSHPTFAAAHLEKAVLSLRCGDKQTAKRHYFTAVTFDSDCDDPQFETKLAEPDSSGAGENSETVLELTPDDIVDLEPTSPEPAVTAVELGEEFANPQPVIQPVKEDTTGEAFPVEEAEEEPLPGEFPQFPVQTVRSAIESGSIVVRPLIHPSSVPPPPVLVYQQDQSFNTPCWAGAESQEENLQNVYVHPHTVEQPVVYDYQEPDDSIFEPVITQDDIYVVAAESEDGQADHNSLESLERNRRRRDRIIARRRQMEKAGALVTSLLVMAAVLFLLWLIKIYIPEEEPPSITATAVVAPRETIKKRTLKRAVISKPTPPPASAAPFSNQVINAAAPSAVAIPDIVTNDTSLELGTGFGAGMSFGNSTGSGIMGSFMGSTIRGYSMAVIFDITGSMYKSNPLVVAEINRKFKSSQVVAVFGACFKDVGESKLVAYKDNKEVLANVEKNGKGSATQKNMNEALFSLMHCYSLPAKGWEIQSLGRAIEALLDQTVVRRPQTIFIFSDFQDGVDPAYMEEIRKLVLRRGTKIVFYHPVGFTRDKAHYEEFAEATKGEVKEGLPKK